MTGPLSGLRVLDLTSVLLGPYCTLLLGDMGAEVIKVESPAGDITRYVGPARHPGMAANFLNLNRNKRSIVLDLKLPAGREAVLRLAQTCDLLVHNMRPQAMADLGLTYDEVRTVNERIVYCGAYGFSEQGPYRGKPAYDDMIQGVSGLAAVQAYVAGEPQYVASAVADRTAGLVTLSAILMALYHRERTGQGQAIEVPMFETIVFGLMLEHMYGKSFDPPLGSAVYPRTTSVHRKPYRTADGYVCAVIYTDRHWQRFFGLAGRPELASDERFRDVSARTQHIDELYAMVADVLKQRTTAEWLAALEQADIPAVPLNSPDSLLSDPHLQSIEFFPMVDHPSEGRVRTIRNPITFSRSPGSIGRLAPRLGQDSREVLREVGYGEHEIDALLDQGVTFQPGA